jgi:hypothetical protein
MLRALGDAPTRSLIELAQRIGVAEAEAATLVVPPAGPPPTASPLLATMRPNGASGAPRTRLNRCVGFTATHRLCEDKHALRAFSLEPPERLSQETLHAVSAVVLL